MKYSYNCYGIHNSYSLEKNADCLYLEFTVLNMSFVSLDVSRVCLVLCTHELPELYPQRPHIHMHLAWPPHSLGAVQLQVYTPRTASAF